MEKTIKLGKKSVKLTNRVKWMVIYKDQFGRDIMPMLIPMANAFVEMAVSVMKATGGKSLDVRKVGDILNTIDLSDVQSAMYALAGLEFTDLLQIVWCMAKAADEDTEEYSAWVDELDGFPVDAVAPVVFDLNLKMLLTSKNYSRLQSAVESLKPKTNSISTES